jgi:transcriptional regulator GlxA family with amidase domain
MPCIVEFMPSGPHRVIAVALPGVVLLDLAAPTHLFGHCGAPHYAFSLATPAPGPVPTSTGLELVVPAGLDALADADTIVVPGVEDLDDHATLTSAAPAIASAHAAGVRVMSICTGAFVLAAAGLLDGRRATTHWRAAAQLARRHPEIEVDPAVLYVDEGTILTSAGVAAGLDLCLHVIRRDHGAALAASLARRTVVAPHRDGGQAQFVRQPIDEPGDAGRSLEPTRAWALARLHETLDVVTLARQACMSPRSFARRFRQETGTTPARWVLDQRTRAAQTLLEGTDLPVEHVAARSGFGSTATLRTHFGRRLATTPTAYRRAFRQR